MSESFAHRVRSELAHVRPPRECCRRSMLVAFVRSAGALHILPNARYALEIGATEPAVARAVYQSLQTLGASPEIRLFSPSRGRPRDRYIVRVESGSAGLFARAGAVDRHGLPAHGVPRGVAARRCCSAAYLRASFIVRGTVSPPRSAAHLQIGAPDADGATGLAALGQRVGARMRTRRHRDEHAAYTKDVASVGAILAAIGAHQGYLDWEAGGVWSNVRGEANRLANADRANVRRTVQASVAQREAIRRLDAERGLDRLPPALRSVARARLEHPNAPIQELAEILEVSKSAVADRLRRLVALAADA